MNHLHNQGVTHFDLKPHNVFIGSGDSISAKVGDFGLSMSENETALGVRWRGTFAYMAPELASLKNGRRYFAPEGLMGRVDVWSFGVILLQMTTRSPLPHVTLTSEELEMILSAEAYYSYHPGWWEVIGKCLETDPMDRPTFAMLVERLIFVAEQLRMEGL